MYIMAGRQQSPTRDATKKNQDKRRQQIEKEKKEEEIANLQQMYRTEVKTLHTLYEQYDNISEFDQVDKITLLKNQYIKEYNRIDKKTPIQFNPEIIKYLESFLISMKNLKDKKQEVDRATKRVENALRQLDEKEGIIPEVEEYNPNSLYKTFRYSAKEGLNNRLETMLKLRYGNNGDPATPKPYKPVPSEEEEKESKLNDAFFTEYKVYNIKEILDGLIGILKGRIANLNREGFITKEAEAKDADEAKSKRWSNIKITALGITTTMLTLAYGYLYYKSQEELSKGMTGGAAIEEEIQEAENEFANIAKNDSPTEIEDAINQTIANLTDEEKTEFEQAKRDIENANLFKELPGDEYEGGKRKRSIKRSTKRNKRNKKNKKSNRKRRA
jgi:hypothetical protein